MLVVRRESSRFRIVVIDVAHRCFFVGFFCARCFVVSCFSPLKAWQPAPGLPLCFNLDKAPFGADVLRPPCNNCIGCRVKNSMMMGTRLVHESEFYDVSMFLTLTYRPEDLPYGGALIKRHVQLFFKRLRRRIAPVQIKIAYCGEYGPSTLRPHFHAVVFGYWPPDAVEVVDRGEGVVDFSSELLSECWSKGFVQFRSLDHGSAMYTARHNILKINGKAREVVNPDTGLRPYERFVEDTGEVVSVSPEFYHQSQGVGLRWLQENFKDCFPEGVLPVPSEFKLIEGVPVYYERKLGEISPVLAKEYEDKKIREAKRLSDEGYFSDYRTEARRKIFLARKALFNLYEKVDI